MTLDDMDTAIGLRNHRRNAIAVRKAVLHNPFDVKVEWTEHQPGNFIDMQPVREFIAAELQRFIDEKNRELFQLGVEVPA